MFYDSRKKDIKSNIKNLKKIIKNSTQKNISQVLNKIL